MIITVAGNIGIPITRRNKEIVDKYGISFNEDDTLESVRDQFSKVKKQHRQLRRVYDTLNRTAVKSIHQYAAKEEGGLQILYLMMFLLFGKQLCLSMRPKKME
jgi:hypothetical protein